MIFENIKFILMDVEGTTTSLSFVKNILFPYSENKLVEFVHKIAEKPDFFEKEDFEVVNNILNKLKLDIAEQKSLNKEEISLNQVCELLIDCIKKDIKYPPLKELQGFLWKYGYKTGDFKGHVYEDVPLAFKKWVEKGIKLGIYSSGSVLAQKLLFKYSEYGDLTTYIQSNFDLTVGGKKEKASYEKIALNLKIEPKEILFLSDILEELDSAKEAGFQVCQILRPEVKEQYTYPVEKDFLTLAFTH